MSLEHAILGFLNYEPMTGYDLKKIVDTSVAHFWPAVQSQIYKTLGRMEADAWVTVETIPQEPKPPRKMYSITETGKNELLRWLETPQPPAETRLAWLIQVFFAGNLSDEKIIALLEHQRGMYRKRLQGYGAIPEENREEMSQDDPRNRFFWLLTVDYGVASAIAQLQWLEKAIETIKNGEYKLPTIG